MFSKEKIRFYLSKPLGLQNKFRLIVTLFLTIIFSSVTFILVNNSSESLTKQVNDQSIAFAHLTNQSIASNYELYFNSGYLKFQDALNYYLNLNSNISKIQIIDTEGYILFDSDNLNQFAPPEKTKLGDKNTVDAINKSDPTYVYSENSKQITEIIYPSYDSWGGHRYSIKYYVSFEEVLKNTDRMRNNILLIATSSLIISLSVISWLISKVILTPIEILSKSASIISQGQLDYQIKVTSKDEVGKLAESVNIMARTLQKNIESLQQVDNLKDEFIAIASHNLRTPLTSIKGFISLLVKDETGSLNLEQKNYLTKTQQSVKQLDSLVEELINLVYFESGHSSLIKVDTDILEIAQDSVNNYKDLAFKKGVDILVVKSSQELPRIKIDKQQIKLALNSLIDNAIKFSKNEGHIIISFDMKDNDLVTHVKDDGVGIAPQELDRLFQKFHRGTDILNYQYSGEGLSLYVTKLIISSHNGRIWAESELGKGSTFSFSLPINTLPQPSNQGNDKLLTTSNSLQ